VDVIEVAVIKAGATLVADPPERKLVVATTVDAQFSMPFAAAVALATGTATVAQFADAPRLARELAPWMAKVRCVTSPRLEAAFPASWQAEVVVRLRDGSTVARSEAAFQGSPGDRATLEQVQDKAVGLLGGDDAARLRAHVLGSRGDQHWTGWQRPDQVPQPQ
jgi:2-methylcitrate dehydratase PrpD